MQMSFSKITLLLLLPFLFSCFTFAQSLPNCDGSQTGDELIICQQGKITHLEELVSTLISRVENLEESTQTTNFDTDWLSLNACETQSFSLPSSELPTVTNAYYRRANGEILLYGMNMYGDSLQSNGVVIDFDLNDKKMYVRPPCGAKNANTILKPYFISGRDKGNVNVTSNDVGFRVQLEYR